MAKSTQPRKNNHKPYRNEQDKLVTRLMQAKQALAFLFGPDTLDLIKGFDLYPDWLRKALYAPPRRMKNAPLRALVEQLESEGRVTVERLRAVAAILRMHDLLVRSVDDNRYYSEMPAEVRTLFDEYREVSFTSDTTRDQLREHLAYFAPLTSWVEQRIVTPTAVAPAAA